MRARHSVREALQHPNIISFHGVADANSTTHTDDHGFCNLHALVLDYMPSGDLADAIGEDNDFVLLQWRSRVLIALQIAWAMEYHSLHGVISSPTICYLISVI